jgi:hypothetical protein
VILRHPKPENPHPESQPRGRDRARPGVGGSGFGICGLIAAVILTAAACGKKGPPLTPFVLVPGAPTVEPPRRVGDDVIVRVVVPAANLDGSKPAAISRIEVFGATSRTPPPRARFLEIATLVGSIPVAAAGDPGDPVPTAPDVASGALQGSTIVVRDPLTDGDLQPRELPVLVAETPRVTTPAAVAAAPPPNVLRRFYMAIAYSGRNRSSPPSAITEVPITVLPPPPADLDVTYTELAVTVQWAPSDGLLGWLVDRSLPPEDDPVRVETRPATAKPPPPPADWLPGPTRYNVYRDLAPDPLVLPASAAVPPWAPVVPVPINAAPLATLRVDDPIVPGDRERCYEVRPLRNGVEGPASPRQCLRPVDVFPPSTPTNLQTVFAAGAMNRMDLIWDPNVDQDLGGYIVLRGEGADATLLPLTDRPIAENRFSDRTVKPGVTYTYEVRAVDRRVPVPNVSEPVRVIETAR